MGPKDAEIGSSISKMDSSLLADHLAKQVKRHMGDLTTLELDEKCLGSRAFLNTAEFEQIHELASLPGFLEAFSPRGATELREPAADPSSPHTLFITSSGIRAADVTRFTEHFLLARVMLMAD